MVILHGDDIIQIYSGTFFQGCHLIVMGAAITRHKTGTRQTLRVEGASENRKQAGLSTTEENISRCLGRNPELLPQLTSCKPHHMKVTCLRLLWAAIVPPTFLVFDDLPPSWTEKEEEKKKEQADNSYHAGAGLHLLDSELSRPQLCLFSA